MKKAEEYVKDFWGTVTNGYNSRGEYISQYDIELIIKQAQIKAIEETVKLCAEKAITKSFKKSQFGKYRKWQNIKDNEEVDLFSYYFMTTIDEDSILNCAEILKKEL